MGDHEVILHDLLERADEMESQANVYGEDLGAPYRSAAHAVRDVVETYKASAPNLSE